MPQKNQNHHKSIATPPTIGLFIESTSELGLGYHSGILAGVQTAVEAQNANLFCFIGGPLNGVPGVPFDSQHNILYQLPSAHSLDGLLIISAIGNFASEKELERLTARYHPLPTVSIGTPIKGTLNVNVDQHKGFYDLLVHLIEQHQYRRLAFIAGPEESRDAQIRYQVYQDVLRRYDIPFDPALVTPGDFRFSSGEKALQLLLDERGVDFEVVVAANDHMAIGAIEELQARGVVVPYDAAIVGFDDIKQTRSVVPPVTTVRQPLHRMGEVAVQMLLAWLAEGVSPEPMILPTELVVRRSCGCFKLPDPPINPLPIREPGESWPQFLLARHEVIVSDLVDVVDFSALQGREGAAQLLDSLADEAIEGEDGRFLALVDRFLQIVVRAGGDLTSWQSLVTVLRRHLLPGMAPDDELWHMAELLHKTQLFIARELRIADAQRALQLERQNWALHEIGQQLITMFDLEGLMDTIATHVPGLGIPACYLVLYEDTSPYIYPPSPPEWSRLMMAYNTDGRLPLPPEGQPFLTRHLLPAGILPRDRQYTMLIEPLYFREEQFGYVVLESGPKEGNVHELLRRQLASAIKGAFLLQAHWQAETALRHHRDRLDELVQERTAELAKTNESLRKEVVERQRMEAALRENEENLSATLHSIGDAVIATDTQSRITRMNPVAEQLTGWTFAEAKGQPLTEVFQIVNAQTGETAVDPVQRVLTEGEIIGLANHTMLIARDNTTYQIADSAAPIRDNNLAISGVVLVFRDVSAEYRVQKTLQAREAQLRTVIEAIPDLVWLKDPDGVFLLCNSKVERLYGAKEAEIAGKTDYNFVEKDVADYFRQMDLAAIAAGQSIIFEEEVTYADDGHRELIETIKMPMYDPAGELIGVLGIARDISERKRAEAELKESRQMLRKVLDTIPVRVFWKDQNGLFLGCNQLFAQDVGKANPEDVIGIDDYALSSAAQADLYRADDRFVMESGHPKINYEEPQTTADGKLAWLNTSKIPLYNSQGELIGILGTYEYITERKEAERLLKESNERLQLALQAANMGTWEWDVTHDRFVWFPETFDLFGVPATAFAGTYQAYLAFVTPESRARVDAQIKRFLADSYQQTVIRYEHEIVRGDGEVAWIEVRGTLFLNETGKPERMIGVFADVTPRKIADRQLTVYMAELERSNRELQEFAYVASHDLQEPLRKIQTFGDRLEKRYYPLLDERGKDYLNRMQSAAARMQTLIVDLLAFSRVRTHGQPFSPVNLSQIIRQVLQDLEIMMTETQAEIAMAELPEIEADAMQIKQLFQNLLSNAIKFRRPEVPPKIVIHGRIHNTWCQITVSDNGIGFDEKYNERIFLVFERLHGRDQYPGTGIGLAICRRIVERHGGYIHAHSKPGEGSTFTVELPLNQPASPVNPKN
ncbi:MAG: PAS domain-containing protein [Chloroflexi bacterium]|nr:PAS domain-containing protein [Ardenticatenaceae bacterium]NOG36588.1 PAS domain-containing protein [Chloroflexota bacterium]